MTTGTKDNWDKASVIGTLLVGTLIPFLIAFYGAKINESIKESENNLKYVEIATSLIRDQPKAENMALRLWAVDVLSHYSRDVPLTKAAQDELRNHSAPIYSTGTTYGWGNTDVITSGNYPVHRRQNPESAPQSR